MELKLLAKAKAKCYFMKGLRKHSVKAKPLTLQLIISTDRTK